jgi:hypothetical protein
LRIRGGKSSFRIPEGFEIQKFDTANALDFSKPKNNSQVGGVEVVLVKQATGLGDKMTYIHKKSDLNPNFYSPVMTLNFVSREDSPNPLEYLKEATKSFLSMLPEAESLFCISDRIGENSAAKAQIEFGEDSRLCYLGFVWQWDPVLFHSSIILPVVRTQEGWMALREFSESVCWEERRRDYGKFKSAIFSTSYEKRKPKAGKQFPI